MSSPVTSRQRPLTASVLASTPLAPSALAASPLAVSPLASSPLASSALAPSALAQLEKLVVRVGHSLHELVAFFSMGIPFERNGGEDVMQATEGKVSATSYNFWLLGRN